MNNLGDLTAFELTFRHARLMNDIEKLPPGTTTSPEKIKEKAALENQLQIILEDNLIGDIFPIIPMAIKIIEDESLITFHFEVFSEMNTLIDRIKVKTKTKDEGWEEARKKAKSYPGQVHLKIS